MWFTPKFTTAEMKKKHGPNFNFELSCDQMCGAGHFGMRGVIVVETQPEFDRWLASKQPQYAAAQTAINPGPLPTTQQGASDTTKPAAATTTTVTTTPGIQ
jgi:cytochrome c oxidase subunit 2